MPYAAIDLPRSVPDAVRWFIADRVEPYLRDARYLLGAPADPGGAQLDASIASILCGVLAGMGHVFYNEISSEGMAFRAIATRYPLQDEPANAISDAAEFAHELDCIRRNGLVQTLGFNFERDDRTGRFILAEVDDRYVIARHPGVRVSDLQLAEMERMSGRPDGLAPTLLRLTSACASPTIRLDVHALYWGVRRVLAALAADPSRAPIAVKVLQPWYVARAGHVERDVVTSSRTQAI